MRPFTFLALAAVVAGCGAVQPAPARHEPSAPLHAKASAASEAQVRTFVRDWFLLFDRNAPTESFLPLIDDLGLDMRVPGRTIRSHADFEDWHASIGPGSTWGIIGAIAGARHAVETIEVERRGAGRFDVHVIVRWQATTAQGEQLTSKADYRWKVHAAGGGLRISQYLVAPAEDGDQTDAGYPCDQYHWYKPGCPGYRPPSADPNKPPVSTDH